MGRPLGDFDDSDWKHGGCHHPFAGWRGSRAASAPCPACSTAAGRFLQGRDQDHRSRRQRLHARGPGREHHRGGRQNRHHHGRRPVRAAARQDQGRDSTISNLPIKYLVNTHYHGDHTGGNEAFAKDGVTIVSDVNVKIRLAEGTTNGLTGVKTPPAAAGALPKKTYAGGTLKIRLPGRVADLRHIAHAHTDGDTYVWFKTANVLSTGDTFTNGRYPNIDFANGGNIKGMIAAADAYLKLTNAKSRIVPGHGPIADKAALTEYRAMLVTARDRMAKLVKEGKSEDDVLAAKPFADLDKKWAPTELASKNFIRVVYHSLADKPDKKSLLKRMLRRS